MDKAYCLDSAVKTITMLTSKNTTTTTNNYNNNNNNNKYRYATCSVY